MKWLGYCKWMVMCCMVAIFTGCHDDDDYRGIMLSGRWFGDLGMYVDGKPAMGSDMEFIPSAFDYTRGHGYETDYYRDIRGRVVEIDHYFDWSIRNGIIYLRFDNPELDCNIRDYSLSTDYFNGFLDGVYSSTRFSLRSYDLYWTDYGYYSTSYRRSVSEDIVPLEEDVASDTPKCTRKVNMEH